jgi:hypothetical protein
MKKAYIHINRWLVLTRKLLAGINPQIDKLPYHRNTNSQSKNTTKTTTNTPTHPTTPNGGGERGGIDSYTSNNT